MKPTFLPLMLLKAAAREGERGREGGREAKFADPLSSSSSSSRLPAQESPATPSPPFRNPHPRSDGFAKVRPSGWQSPRQASKPPKQTPQRREGGGQAGQARRLGTIPNLVFLQTTVAGGGVHLGGAGRTTPRPASPQASPTQALTHSPPHSTADKGGKGQAERAPPARLEEEARQALPGHGGAAAAGSWEEAPAAAQQQPPPPSPSALESLRRSPPHLPRARPPSGGVCSPRGGAPESHRSHFPSGRGDEKLAGGGGRAEAKARQAPAEEEVGPGGPGCDCGGGRRKWLLPALPMGVWS